LGGRHVRRPGHRDRAHGIGQSARGGEDVDNGKPFPDPYLVAAQRLQLSSARCAVFEDAPAGISAARAAGVTTIIGVGPAALAADVTLAITDLRGVRFDGRRLRIAATSILPPAGE
jgi:sugar-phosphatase